MDQYLNYIRGIAALSVVVYHYFIFFFTNQTFCANLCFFTPLTFMSPFIDTISNFPFDLGKFAVTLFFLLSGFLTPYLVERYATRRAFLKNRFFRLWPIYAVGLLINIVFVVAGSFYTQIEWPYSFDHVLASFLCLRDLLGYSFITGIVWTFEIEVKFIIFCLFVFSLIKGAKVYKLLLAQICIFTLAASFYLFLKETLDQPDIFFSIVKSLSKDSKYFCLILLGMYLNFLKTSKLSMFNFSLVSVLSILTLSCEESLIVSPEYLFPHLINYSSAVLVFGFAIFKDISNPLQRTSQGLVAKTLVYISKISYPLYLIHAVPGYIVMYILYDLGYSLEVGIILGIAASIWGADLLHKYIENPFHAFGRRSK